MSHINERTDIIAAVHLDMFHSTLKKRVKWFQLTSKLVTQANQKEARDKFVT